MADPRREVYDALTSNKVIPVVTTAHIADQNTAVKLARALYDGGCKVIEPPLVCRRAFGSNVRLLFHLGSRLHRTSPLLHAA